MRIGTKSLLFGLHQFMLHPLLMFVAYIKLFRQLPSLMESIAIVVHDWGYFGCEGIDSNGGEKHPYLGAAICQALFGQAGWEFCIGHNDELRVIHNIQRSRLYTVDKYYYVLIPSFLHRLLGTLSGECIEIEEMTCEKWNPADYKAKMLRRFITGEIIVM